MFKRLFLFIVLSIFLLGVPSQIYAEVGYEKINPSDGFNYGLKRFKEKITYFFKFSKDSKAEFLAKQADMRLSELKHTIEQKDVANFETSTTRYFTTVGQYTSFLKEKKVTYDKNSIVKKFNEHIDVIKELQKKYDGTTAEWRFLEDDVNYVRIYLESI